jgi:hypothetical protein
VNFPALVVHLVFLSLEVFSFLIKLWFISVAPQPESKSTLRRFQCLAFLLPFLDAR